MRGEWSVSCCSVVLLVLSLRDVGVYLSLSPCVVSVGKTAAAAHAAYAALVASETCM